jgi:hypothetical protein
MWRDAIVIPFRQLAGIDNPLSELARVGAHRMLAQVRSATSRRGDTCTCGRMGSTRRPEWKKTPNACWC